MLDMVEVKVEESLGLEETRKKGDEEEGVVRIRGFSAARRRVGAGQGNRAVVISRLRAEGKSSRCIEKESPDTVHSLYLRLRAHLCSHGNENIRVQVPLDVAGRKPLMSKKLEMSMNENGVLLGDSNSFSGEKQCAVF